MTRKNVHILCFLVILFFGIPSISYAQLSDYQLAEQYFKQGEFDKAATYYLKSYKKTNSSSFFDKYIESLTRAENFEEAEKALKKEIKKRPDRLALQVQLGEVFWQAENKNEAYKTWDEVLKTLPTNSGEIIPMAYLFQKLNHQDYTLKCYELGKKYVSGFYAYYPQMAELYGSLGQYDKMIDTYLELLEINEAYLQTVQTMLNRAFDFTTPSDKTQLLKQKLLQKINKYPDKLIYSEMLIWLYLQQSDFDGAFVQVRSLDKRFNENGSRLIGFARLAQSNQQYAIASTAYQAVLDKGPDLPYFETAKVENLTVKKMKLESTPVTTKKDYEELVNQYLTTISELGIVDFMAPSIRELAQLYALKLQNLPNAISWLQKVLDEPGISKTEIALTKIDLGDYLVMNDEIWEAVLYYMQAEKAFKYDEIGDVAKLRAAKVAYYTGDFAWAAAKLDILKGSTSKLISNDALYLSNLITDNTTIDTNLVPMEMYARADLRFVQQNYSAALEILDSIQSLFPYHMLADEVLFQKYKIHFAQGNFTAAESDLKQLHSQFGEDILADDAVYYLGQLSEIYLDNKEQAMEFYLLILTDYPDSIFVTDARKRYRILRGDSV